MIMEINRFTDRQTQPAPGVGRPEAQPVRRASGCPRTRPGFAPAASQVNVADFLRGTLRVNVPIRRTVFEVSDQCRIAIIGGPLLTIMRRASNE